MWTPHSKQPFPRCSKRPSFPRNPRRFVEFPEIGVTKARAPCQLGFMLDMALRGGTIATGAVLVAVVVMRGRADARAWSVLASWLCLAGYLLISAPQGHQMPAVLQRAATLLAELAPLSVVWVVCSILLSRSPWQSLLFALGFAVVAMGLLANIWPMIGLGRGVFALALYLCLVIAALRQQTDDLVAKRRALRRGFIVVLGITGLIITAVEVAGLGKAPPEPLLLVQATALFAIVFAFTAFALTPNAEILPDKTTPKAAPMQPKTEASPLASRVLAAMQDGIWRREGLSIGTMAQDLAVPEYRLRRTINQELGYRNFSTFINAARVQAACDALADPSQMTRPVLDIAYDVGFASLGPFNRAFREQTGQSPTAFREAALSGASIPANSA